MIINRWLSANSMNNEKTDLDLVTRGSASLTIDTLPVTVILRISLSEQIRNQ